MVRFSTLYVESERLFQATDGWTRRVLPPTMLSHRPADKWKCPQSEQCALSMSKCTAMIVWYTPQGFQQEPVTANMALSDVMSTSPCGTWEEFSWTSEKISQTHSGTRPYQSTFTLFGFPRFVWLLPPPPNQTHYQTFNSNKNFRLGSERLFFPVTSPLGFIIAHMGIEVQNTIRRVQEVFCLVHKHR